MLKKVFKILFFTEKKFFVFIFISLFLSVFSYVLSDNLIRSVNNAVKAEINPVLGGDLVLSSKQDFLSKEYFLNTYSDIEVSKQISFDTTVFIQEQPKLFNVILYDENYPLYGEFEYNILQPDGQILVNQENFESLVNQKIPILGNDYQLQGYYTKSPLNEISFFNEGRYMYLPIHLLQDKIVSNLSRIDYSYFIKYNGLDISVINDITADPKLKNINIRTVESGNQRLNTIVERLSVFVSFFNQTIFILAFFIIILAIESYYRKVLKNLGVLNILGCKRKSILFYNVLFFLLFVLINICLVALSVYIMIQYYQGLYGGYFVFYPNTILKGAFVSSIIVFIGLFSSFYKILGTPSGELAKEENTLSIHHISYYIQYILVIFLGFVGINMISGNPFITAIKTSVVFLVLFIVLLGIIQGGVWLLYKIHKIQDFYIKDAIRSTVRPGNISYLIIFSTLISFTGFIVFSSLGWSFLGFLNTLKVTGNDTFVVNLVASDIPKIQKYFVDEPIFTIIPSRIKKINGSELEEYLKNDRVSGELGREFFATTHNLDGIILKGKPIQTGEVSLDQEFAKRSSLKIGDRITFIIAGIEKTLKVANIRKPQRDGTNPFFYFQYKSEDFEKFPKSYFISYDSKTKENDFEKKIFDATGGNISFIKTGDILKVVISLSEKIIFFVYIVLIYIGVFCLLSFFIALLFLQSFKNYKKNLLSYLGSPRNKIQFNVHFEYSYLVILGFLLSIIVSLILLLLVLRNIDYFSLEWKSFGWGIGMCLTYLIALFGGFKVFGK